LFGLLALLPEPFLIRALESFFPVLVNAGACLTSFGK
jgi:hypothetical protein